MNIDLNTLNLDSGTVKAGFFLIGIAFLIVIAMLFVVFYKIGKKLGKMEYRRFLGEDIASAREDAVKRSRAVLTGQIAEQLAPFLPGFPCNADDCRFIGKPIDFIAFSGLSRDTVDEVVFVEVKTGNSQLSKRERAIKDAVDNGRVRYVIYNPENAQTNAQSSARMAQALQTQMHSAQQFTGQIQATPQMQSAQQTNYAKNAYTTQINAPQNQAHQAQTVPSAFPEYAYIPQTNAPKTAYGNFASNSSNAQNTNFNNNAFISREQYIAAAAAFAGSDNLSSIENIPVQDGMLLRKHETAVQSQDESASATARYDNKTVPYFAHDFSRVMEQDDDDLYGAYFDANGGAQNGANSNGANATNLQKEIPKKKLNIMEFLFPKD